MKTQTTFVVAQGNFTKLILFYICFLFSLNSNSQKIISTVTDVWDNGTWKNSSKTINTYDGNGYLIKDLTQGLNIIWKDLYQTDYNNNPDGTVKQRTSLLNTSGNIWETSGRTTYTYNAAKKVLTSEHEYWYDPVWSLFSKQIYTYDGSNYLTKILTQTYDSFTLTWKDASRTTYSNNLDGTVNQSVVETWNVNDWKFSNRRTYTYSNSKLITELAEKWNGTIWENDSKITSTYNSNGYLINTLSQIWTAGTWKNERQSIFSNDVNGNRFQFVEQYWNSSNVWENTYMVTFNYVALGVDEQVLDKSFTFYPNPAQDKITIKIDNNDLGVKYLVTDQLGRQFLNGTITARETVLDVAQFSNGIYFIQVGQNKNETIKMVKK